MADQMLHFPSRSSSAVDRKLHADLEEPIEPEASSPVWPARHRRLFLVKGQHVPAAAPQTAARVSRISQTRMIVAQVEQEIAAIAARRRTERFGRVHAMPMADATGKAPHRDTPWTILTRLIRSLHRP